MYLTRSRESLYHVSPEAYCSLLGELAEGPIPSQLFPNSDHDTLQYLLKRARLSTHEEALLKLSISLNEFAPTAGFNASSTSHNCSSADVYETVYTDFLSPFEYSPSTIVRYVSPKVQSYAERRTMSGYGAHLALKRTDYLVIDDSNPTTPDPDAQSKKVEPLKMNQISNIGLRAVSRIVKSDDPLSELEDVSQNFPMRATKLLGSKVSKELKDEVVDVRGIIRGDIFIINGVEVVPTPDKLLPLMRSESALSRALRKHGLSNSQVVNLLTFELELSAKVDRFEVRGPAVAYLNDFESDKMYEDWPASVETFMRPLYPGQFHTIRRNAHTVIMLVDLSNADDRELVSNFAMFVTRGLPLRWGIVPADDTPMKLALAKTWREVLRVRGPVQAVEYLAAASETEDVANVYSAWQKREGESMIDFGSLDDTLLSQAWSTRFGGSNAYANGRPVLKDDNLMQKISAVLRDDTMQIQEAMIEGGIEDTGDLQDFFLGPDPLPKYSEALFGPRSHLSLQELKQFETGNCQEDFNIVLSGSWPEEFMDSSSPCIRLVEGPKKLLINGRVVADLDVTEIPTLIAQEQQDLDKYRAAAERAAAPMSAEILSLLRTSSVTRTILPPLASTELTQFSFGDAATCSLSVEVYVDPLSENAQKWSTVLKTLRNLPDIHIKVQLVPKIGLKELPLKRFYRYLMPFEPSFTSEGIEFSDIPADLLVFSLDVWNGWVTSPLYAAVDLDNLHLGSSSLDVDFEVSHILVQGHAKEAGSTAPPRGAQLTLSAPGLDTAETIIMANLGYFQFKAQLGSWTLAIKSGRSSEVYDLENSDIDIASWAGVTIYPRLTRKPGQESTDILDDKLVAPKGSLWTKLKGFAGSEVVKKTSAHADINIFTVASGHLYERFVYIMISSVMAHTDHSVKFWFISNFLSPQFRQFIPHLAAHLSFEYEMITFTWPHWLRQQTEKQRIIWGYKILFLDVMFPLDLEKVIFVDADQIVRTDMMELIDEDLRGKVWGYTPMCDSRKEIEGFRFWKKGYWKDFLRGKPYHISALYVIDLVAFRAQATGDRLRQQYHQLSADPASLSNLDQDLPNHLQAQIPIHSLSQEWLWCETWCSDESLREAKTIDLCQNPMTKEPKLDRARRQLPEWSVYDQRIKEFARTVAASEEEEQRSRFGSILVDVDSVGQNVEMKRDQLGGGDDDNNDDSDDEPAAATSTDGPRGSAGHDEL